MNRRNETEDLVMVFKALGDETRLRIMKLLEDEALCVCEVMAVLDMIQSRVSRHLDILKRAGFLTATRDKKWVVYEWNRERRNPYHLSLQELLRLWLNDDERVKRDKEKLQEVKTQGLREKNGVVV